MGTAKRQAASIRGWVLLINAVASVLGCAAEDNDPGRPPAVVVEQGVTVVRGVLYQSSPEPMKLDLYLPVGRERPMPVVVVLHGGAWVGGGRAVDREVRISRQIAAMGYVVASVSYHVGGGNQTGWWPRNLLDCKRSIRFLRLNADHYGIDPGRVAVLGDSAGGHLAMMVGFTSGVTELEPTEDAGVSDRVRAVVTMYGVADLLNRQGTDDDGNPDGEFADSYGYRMLGASHTADPAKWRAASPVSYISDRSPPVLILHGTADTSVDRDQAAILDRALTVAGVDHRLVLLPGVGHAFDLQQWGGRPLPMDLRPVVESFLQRAFAKKG